MSIGHKNEARSTNFLFTVGMDKELTFSVQSANINEITFGSAPFMTGAKDLKIPTNKVENGPLTIDILVSEDYSEWVEIYKWIMKCKNSNNALAHQAKTCELVALDAQNRPSTRFVYGDCFPTDLGGAPLASNDETSNIVTIDVTLMFNKFSIILPNGEVVDEQYTG